MNFTAEKKRYVAIRREPLRIAAYLFFSAVKKIPANAGILNFIKSKAV